MKLSSVCSLDLGGMNFVFRGIADVRWLPDTREYLSCER